MFFVMQNSHSLKETFYYSSECSFLCLPEDDSRWQPMCNHPLNAGGSSRQDRLSGMEECKSPFGIYELNIPVDANLACTNSGIVNTNCKDLDVSNMVKKLRRNISFSWTKIEYQNN